ncbi:MAG: hypothetical protein ABJM19_05095 [Marinobacter sp.]|uniref:hypothetical protein n=1 Tax=Marinobacter sp. TaxID=50741 RepID=UPI0032971F6E
MCPLFAKLRVNCWQLFYNLSDPAVEDTLYEIESIGIAHDKDGHSLATAPVQRQIQAEALRSEVQSLMGQSLNVYFQKRR